MPKTVILRVAVDVPLPRYFDYLLPREWQGPPPAPGVRVSVPFGRGRRIGIVAEIADHSDLEPARLKAVGAVIDERPVLDEQVLALVHWATGYYRHAPGEALAAALPVLLRKGRPASRDERCWSLTPAGAATDAGEQLRRAPRQAALLKSISLRGGTVGAAEFDDCDFDWRRAMRALLERDFVRTATRRQAKPAPSGELRDGPTLSAAQRAAVAAVNEAHGGFRGFLLHGVTGSGKTEVYLHQIRQTLAAGRQALVLVPEIGLTPQLVRRFRERLDAPLAVMHSGLSSGERLDAWCRARDGDARVIIGTRSAIFAPAGDIGLIIVDEEHDASFKQQEGFRYSARDLAVFRARRAGVPVVLGSATPSLESLHNVDHGRYTLLELPQRAGAAKPPVARVIDLSIQASRQGLSTALAEAIRSHLDAGGQVLLFLNRRGYAPAWFCTGCGSVAKCRRCEVNLTLHQSQHGNRLICHHCGQQAAAATTCTDCGSDMTPVGQGTERIEEVLNSTFADVPVTRIDRDSTRRRGELEKRLEAARDGEPRILLGTQMLAKGHHFPRVTLVGILNADQGLFGTEFRSNERLAQLIVQVAGRAGRAERAGEVLIQTSFPQHPLLLRLIHEGYAGFARAALAERHAAGWPPFTSLAVLRASATQSSDPLNFLQQAKRAGETVGAADVDLFGPTPAPMPKRAGRYRAQLLVQSARRGPLHAFLDRWSTMLETLPAARSVRWSLDVDPADLF